MKKLSFTKRFGLLFAGIGALVAAISLATNTLDASQAVASTVMVVVGVVMYFLS